MGYPAAASDPPEIIPYLWRNVKYGNLAFEVGANQGQSLPEMTRMFGRVVAFEPYEPSFEMASKVSSADVRMMAVSDHDGEVTMTMLEHQFRSPGHEAAERYDFSQYPAITVPCVSLDTLILTEGVPDFVNMDVEGHELDVLRGAAQLLAAKRTYWLIEFHSLQQHDDCTSLLQAAGFEVETVRHPHYEHGSRTFFAHGWLLANPAA